MSGAEATNAPAAGVAQAPADLDGLKVRLIGLACEAADRGDLSALSELLELRVTLVSPEAEVRRIVRAELLKRAERLKAALPEAAPPEAPSAAAAETSASLQRLRAKLLSLAYEAADAKDIPRLRAVMGLRSELVSAEAEVRWIVRSELGAKLDAKAIWSYRGQKEEAEEEDPSAPKPASAPQPPKAGGA